MPKGIPSRADHHLSARLNAAETTIAGKLISSHQVYRWRKDGLLPAGTINRGTSRGAEHSYPDASYGQARMVAYLYDQARKTYLVTCNLFALGYPVEDPYIRTAMQHLLEAQQVTLERTALAADNQPRLSDLAEDFSEHLRRHQPELFPHWTSASVEAEQRYVDEWTSILGVTDSFSSRTAKEHAVSELTHRLHGGDVKASEVAAILGVDRDLASRLKVDQTMVTQALEFPMRNPLESTEHLNQLSAEDLIAVREKVRIKAVMGALLPDSPTAHWISCRFCFATRVTILIPQVDPPENDYRQFEQVARETFGTDWPTALFTIPDSS